MRTRLRIPVQSGALLLGIAAALVGQGAGCTHPSASAPDGFGEVKLGLNLSPSIVVTKVSYKITGNGISMINGTIDVTNMTHATALVSGIPVNTMPYTAFMHADSTDGNTHCDGSAMFVVIANATSNADVVLQCRGNGSGVGVVVLDGRLDNCPYIKQYSVSALQAPVGGVITIGVVGVDLDPSDTITYQWTAEPSNVGTFGNDKAANATFTCTGSGTTNLSIAISDGVCGDNRHPAIPLTCGTPSSGGAGTGGAAGAGGAAGGSGAAGAGGTTGAAGSAGTTGSAGAGGSGAGGSAAGAGGSAGVLATQCPSHELLSGNAAMCESCTANMCDLSAATGDSGCCALTDPTDQALCAAVSLCIQSPPGGTACTTNGDPVHCFCGSATSNCFSTAGAANGACVAPMTAAAKSTTPADIQLAFTNTESPLGRAVNLETCRGANCKTQCAIQ